MKKKIHLRSPFYVVLFCVLTFTLLVLSLDQAIAREKVRFCIGSDAIYSAVSWMALKSGAFEEEGLELEISKTAGGSKAAAAVLSGSV